MRIGIFGCAGRMGRMLAQAVLAEDGCTLAGGCERPDHPAVGTDLGIVLGRQPLGIAVTGDDALLFGQCDTVIDFSAPAATAHHADLAAQTGVALVAGTTGLDETQRNMLSAAARSVPVVFAANMSVGVNLLIGLTERVAQLLPETYDIEIVEMHHRMKADAPSGTALTLGRAAAQGRGIDLGARAIRARDGQTGPRPQGAIGFATLRGGDVVGEHTVIFAGDGERIELTHKASSRAVFVKGALRAALWTAGRPPGLYGMGDVLGLG